MSRIRKAYQARFRTLLQRARARQVDQGVQRLVAQASQLAAQERLTPEQALTRVYERLARQPFFQKAQSVPAPDRFICDAGLGGLARWLRGAGYEALWRADIDDDELLVEAGQSNAAVLTTDSMLMERRLLRDRVLRSLWLPPTLRAPEQLEIVFREFGLGLQAPRCMACGGELRLVDKEVVRDRIPPRTYRWLDEFFLCARCGQLFWHGTHWERIRGRLARLSSGPALAS